MAFAWWYFGNRAPNGLTLWDSYNVNEDLMKIVSMESGGSQPLVVLLTPDGVDIVASALQCH